MQRAESAFRLAEPRVGSSSPAKMAMIETTARSSISVKAFFLCRTKPSVRKFALIGRLLLITALELKTYLKQPPNPFTNSPPYGGVFFCPSDLERRSRAGLWSYGYNDLGVANMFWHLGQMGRGLGVRVPFPFVDGTSWSSDLPAAPTQESDVRVPSEMIAIADAFSGRNRVDKNFLLEGRYDITRYGSAGPYSRNDIHFARTRHRGRLNVTFCDGHVEAMKLYSLFFEETDEAYKRWNRDNEPHRPP